MLFLHSSWFFSLLHYGSIKRCSSDHVKLSKIPTYVLNLAGLTIVQFKFIGLAGEPVGGKIAKTLAKYRKFMSHIV